MMRLEAEQKVFEIAGVKVGGIPGRDPTVLIGTIFYKKQRIVEDDRRGVFDEEKAEELIRLQEEFSDRTGNPSMLDVEGATSEALKRYLEFAADSTDEPLLLGGPTPEVRIEALKWAGEVGLTNRIVYNSLLPGCGREELEVIRDAGVECAILLAYNVSDLTAAGRIKALQELLKTVGDYGIEKPILDTFVMDIPSLGAALQAISEAKSRWGLPAGCGPHNAIGLWRGLKKKMGIKARRPAVAAVNAVAAALGADFLLYGPIEEAPYVYPAVAMVDAAYAFPAMRGGLKLSREHPLFKIP